MLDICSDNSNDFNDFGFIILYDVGYGYDILICVPICLEKHR